MVSMSEPNTELGSPVEPNKTPQSSEIPTGMSKEAWEKMNLTWGIIEALNSPPSEKAQHVAGGDKFMESIFQMTEGILKAGERMGMHADDIQSTVQSVFKPDTSETEQQTPTPTIPIKQG